MTVAIFTMELRLRARNAAAAAFGLVALTALVGALFPSLRTSIGKLDVGDGVGNLVGGGDLSGIDGWLRAEIVAVYGPLVFAFLGIRAAVATTAREEEAGILGLVLAHPVPRARLLLAKAAAVATLLAGVAVAVFVGMLVGVALAGAASPSVAWRPRRCTCCCSASRSPLSRWPSPPPPGARARRPPSPPPRPSRCTWSTGSLRRWTRSTGRGT